MDESNVAAPAADEPLTARAAASLLGAAPEKKPDTGTEQEPATPSEPEERGAADESADEADATPPEAEPSGETEGEDDPDDAPTIDPPRSWTKEDKAAFALLPRDTQERLLALDRTRELELRRGQNEAAEAKKAIEAERQAAEQARQQYEHALPTLLQQIEAVQASEFAHVQTWDDLAALQQNDPLGFQRYQLLQQRADAVRQEAQAAQRQQQQDMQARWQEFVAQQDQLAAQRIPDLVDPEKAEKAAKQARSFLTDLGFSDAEITDHWNGRPLSMRDARVQEAFWKATRFDAAQKAAKTATAATPPPVQRPGAAPSKGERSQGAIKDLNDRFNRSQSPRDAARLLAAMRARSK